MTWFRWLTTTREDNLCENEASIAWGRGRGRMLRGLEDLTFLIYRLWRRLADCVN